MATALDLHPQHEGQRYSLAGLFITEEAAERAALRHKANGKTAILFSLDCPSGRMLFAVASRTEAFRTRRARLPHDYSSPWLATRVALEAFRAAERAAARRGARLRWYKPLDERLLHRTLTQMDWKGQKLDVAARLISNLVIAHPFPNANHRTSTALARLYLAAEGIAWPPYDLRGRGIDRFIRDTEPFVLRSKYLLHVMRHGPMFTIAYDEGFREAAVKPHKCVPLLPDETGAGPAALVAKHEASCRAMICAIDGGPNAHRLAEPARKGLREWMQLYGED